ncbi:MAG: hypothetical protein Q8N13_15510 [Acidovorax sp.]|nr:hypothetical protein [Acidovorax sp.]
MITPIVLTLAALGILLMLGAAITFSWLCGLAAGRAVGWAMAADLPQQAGDPLAAGRIAEIDALVAESQQLLRESQRRAAFALK